MISPRAFLPSALIAAVLLAGAAWPGPPRPFQALVAIALLTALARTGWRIAGLLIPESDAAFRVTAGFTVAVGLATVPATVLGHFGVLRPAAFLVWGAVVALAGAFLTPRPPLPTFHPPSGRGGENKGARVEVSLLLAAVAAITLKGAHRILQLLPEAAGRHDFDDLCYHLPAVALWHRYGDLRMIKFAMGDPNMAFYPIVGELASWVLLAPFGDSDFAARWSQLPFAVLSFPAILAIARLLGLGWRPATLAGLLYLSIPRVFPTLALTAGNDHVTAFFTLAALAGALEAGRRPRPGIALFTGLALGLLAGTKFVGLLNAATVLGLLAVLWVLRRPSLREALKMSSLLSAAMALAGGYTYLRNAVTAGNPLFPVPIHLFGREILPGWESSTIAARSAGSEWELDVWSFLTTREDLFGPLFPFLLLPAAMLAPLAALVLPRRKTETVLVLSLPIVFFLEFLYLTPDHRDMRYFLAGIALAGVGFAWLAERAGPRVGVVLRGLRGVVALVIARLALDYGKLSDAREILILVLLAGLAAVLFRIEWTPAKRRVAWAAGAAALVLAAFPIGWAVEHYQRVKFEMMPAPLALERLSGGRGARVGYAGWNQPYLFFGKRLQNEVHIVPHTGRLAARYYTWGGTVEFPFQGSFRRWRRAIDRLGIEYVVLIRSPEEDPERHWMRRRPDQFRRIYEGNAAEIWRVLPAGSDRPERKQRGGRTGATPGRGSGSRRSRPAAPPPG
jgi:hypothetical protein